MLWSEVYRSTSTSKLYLRTVLKPPKSGEEKEKQGEQIKLACE